MSTSSAVSGLGCGEILGGESGLHVLEHVGEAADGGQVVDRDQVQVVVSGNAAGAPEAAEATGASKVVVRRYRPGKSPSSATACVAIEPGGSISSSAATSTCSS